MSKGRPDHQIGDLNRIREARLKADRGASMSDRLAKVHVISKQMTAIKGAARR